MFDDRVARRANHVGVNHLRLGNRVGQSPTIDELCRRIEQLLQSAPERSQTTGPMEILHQVLTARANIRNDWNLSGPSIEIIQSDFEAGSASHGNQVNDSVGRPADRQLRDHGIDKRAGR